MMLITKGDQQHGKRENDDDIYKRKMPFIRNYNAAMKILSSIGNGKIHGSLKSNWIRNLKYALKTTTNPLHLNKTERKNLVEKIKSVSGKDGVNNHAKTLKKYKTRNSPSCSANKNCGKTMKGNDGAMYLSKANKNNVCTWQKV